MSRDYRRELDGLRALAVLAVIVNHLERQWMPGGYLGVDIFFVISGYVITASLFFRSDRGLGDLLLNFYARRIKRLAPALIVFVGVTAVAIALFDPRPWGHLKTGAAALFGLSNIYLIVQAADYFSDSTQLNVFVHTWSLGVEEQFYAVFPFMVWLLGFRQLNGSRQGRFYWVLGLSAVASLAAFVWLGTSKPIVSYYSMPTRFWELAAGALAFGWLNRRDTDGSAGTSAWIAALALACMLAVLFVPETYHTLSTIAVVAATVAFIVAVRRDTAVYRLLTRKPVIYIGLISYSLYLWHWGVIAVSRWTVGVHWWTVPFLLVAMFGLAALSYHCIERPLRAANWSARPSITIGYGLATSACLCLALVLVLNPMSGRLYAGRLPAMAAVGTSTLTDAYSLQGTDSVWMGDPCVLSDNDQVGKVIPRRACTLGNFENARKHVLVIGNSMSTAFVQAFDDLVLRDGYSVTLVSSWGASPVREIANRGAWNRANDDYWARVVPESIQGLRPGDWVFMINDVAELSPKVATPESIERLQTLANGLEAFSDNLASRNIRLAVLHGNPFARDANCEPVSAVKQWFSPFDSVCKFYTKDDTLRRRENLDKVLRGLESRKKIKVVDLIDIFCPGTVCNYSAANGQILYRDVWSHPSVEGARLSSAAIRKVFVADMH